MGHSKDSSFTVFRSAAEEAQTKRDERIREDHGGHMSSTSGRVTHMPGAKLPYVVTLTHHRSEATEHAFATMRGMSRRCPATVCRSGSVSRV